MTAQSAAWIVPVGRPAIDALVIAAGRLPTDQPLPSDLAALGGPSAEIVTIAAAVRDELEHGRGFVVLRGLHVADRGLDYDDPSVRGYQTCARLDYHVDGSDVVGLLCVRAAKSGGTSTIVSSAAIHDHLAEHRPDVCALLHEPFWFDRRNGDGPESFYALPIFSRPDAGRITMYYGRSYRTGRSRNAGATWFACGCRSTTAARPTWCPDRLANPVSGHVMTVSRHLIGRHAGQIRAAVVHEKGRSR